jgi:hypothetical protein
MAIVVADLPKFSIEDGDDFDVFTHLYLGHLNTVGVNPNAGGGPPSGRDRAMGILRSCMKGSVANWFDERITGKNWKLKYFLARNVANMGALVASTVVQDGGGGNLPVNSFEAGLLADLYSRNAVNALITVQQAFIPDHDPLGGDQQWERIGAEPTGDPVNAVNAGNGQPIVLGGIRAHQALYYMRHKLPPIVDKKRKFELHKLVQGDRPVRVYYDDLQKYGKWLKLPQEIVDDHYYRGLSYDASWEAERLDPELSTSKVTDILERIEKRNASMQSAQGRHAERSQLEQTRRNVMPVEAPPVMSQQEPAELRKIAPKAIAQEHLEGMFNAHTDRIAKGFQDQIQAFQTQIKALQDALAPQTASQPQYRQHSSRIPIRKSKGESWQEVYENRPPQYPGDDQREFTMEDILGEDSIPDRKTLEYAKILAKASAKARQAKMDRKIDKLTTALENVSLYDSDEGDPMDTSNIADSVILRDANGNEFTAFVTRGSKKK